MCHVQMKIYYAFKRNIKRNTDVPKFKSIYITQYGLKKKETRNETSIYSIYIHVKTLSLKQYTNTHGTLL